MIKKNLIWVLMSVLLVGNVFSFSATLLNTNPAPIVAGDYADVTVRFSNDKSENVIENVYFGFDGDKELFTLVDGPNDKISKVYQGDYFTRTFRIFFSEDLNEGSIELPFFVSSDGVKKTFKLPVSIKDSLDIPKLYVGSVKSTPNELLPDTDNNKLKVTLQNLGDKDAELVSAKLVVDSKVVSESFSYSLMDSKASIKSGAEAVFEFTIDLDENAVGIIDSEIELNYRYKKAVGNSYEIKSEKLPLEIKVSDSPRLIISDIELVDEFKVGSVDNRVRLTIKNVGNEKAKDVRVRLSPDISYPLVYNDITKYVTSNIDVGETSVVEYEVEVLKSASARVYGVKANLESVVGDSRYSNEGTLNIEVKEGKKGSTTGAGTIIIGLIILCSALFGFYSLKNSKKNK